MTLRDTIKGLCKERNISLNKLETELGFAKGYVSKLDKSTPNSAKIQQIADYFGVTVDYLITGKDNRYSDADALLDVRISEDFELKEAIKKYYALDDRKKKHVLELIDLLSIEQWLCIYWYFRLFCFSS